MASSSCFCIWHDEIRAVRAISSDKVRIVTGSDDQRVLVWDKLTGKQLVELKTHSDRVHSTSYYSCFVNCII